jgi:thioredoxin reductase
MATKLATVAIRGDCQAMTYDVIVIGGGPAGLSGAVALGRALRSVLVIDSGEPRNGPADGIHNYLTRDGMSPADFRAAGQAEVRKFGGEVIEGRVVSATTGFTVALADGREFGARRLLVTTGLVDRLPDIPGIAERWGRTVLHCPYCHGYEVQGRAVGIIGAGPMSVEQALTWRQWTPDLTLFGNDLVTPDDDRLAAAGIGVVPSRIAEVTDTAVILADGTSHKAEALVVLARIAARAEPLVSLGLRTTENEFGTYVPVADPTGRTEVPGVWVAGNVTDFRAQVISSAAAGLMAGAAINGDLMMEGYSAASSR